MYKKVLVPYDGSPFSDRAAEHAMIIAKMSGAQVRFVSATVLPSLIYTYQEAANAAINEAAQLLIKSSRDSMEKSLGELIERCKKEGISASYVHKVGDPATLILDLAKEERIDLIVMGSRGRTGISKLILGSVSRKVVEHAICPVLIVH